MRTAGRLSTPVYRALAIAAAGTGALGVLLPLLPTTPLLLIALWASARGAPEWHERIRQHPRLKPSIDAWQHERAIPGRARIVACALMAGGWVTAWIGGMGLAGLVILAAGLLAIAAFLLSRPMPSKPGR